MSLIENKTLANLSNLISKIEEKPATNNNKSIEIFKDNTRNTKVTKSIKRNYTLEQQYILILLRIKEYNISLISFQFLKNEYKYTLDESFNFFLHCKKHNLIINNHFHADNVHLNTKKVIDYIDFYFGGSNAK